GVCGVGCAGLGWRGLDQVRGADVVASEADGLDDLGEELAGLTDEGQALRVLVRARAFAHEHEPRARIALPEHDRLAAGGELAPLAIADRRADRLERAGRARGCSS